MYQVAHIGIVVGDCERSSQFYQQVLGCECVEEFENSALKIKFMQLEGGLLELIQHKDVAGEYSQAGPVDHLALAVNDIEAEVKRLREMGINCLFEKPREVLAGKKIMFFTGPDGERLEFIQEN